MNNLLTLNQAREIISRNNSRPVSKSTIGAWVRQGLLPVSRLGRIYVVDKTNAENFVIADRVRRKGNPGYPRPKCEHFAPGQGRCLRTARWTIVAETGGHTVSMLRCDEHKKKLVANAETGTFRIISADKMPRQEKK